MLPNSIIIAWLTCLAFASTAHAAVPDGQSSQSVLVVVNSKSSASLAIANHYIALRNIPPVNVVYLDQITTQDDESMRSSKFRSEILTPILKLMQDRGIEQQINCVAYSAGFPNRVLIQPEVDKYLAFRNKEFDRHYHAAFASISSATFFQKELFSNEPTFLDDHSNWYARNEFGSSRIFSSQTGWSKKSVDPEMRRKYLLSTVLAIVRLDGSTLSQATDQLTKSVAADGKRPHGVFYFANHGDPRSRTRDHQYTLAANVLRQMGFKAEVSRYKMPKGKRVLGATMGSAKLDWTTSGSEFAPGAICDNFTSYGAWWKSSQTKLTHFLNHGAAGATGTICEPYTIPAKIPTTAMHVHYARGCTLAESVYQTVMSPFQLLTVGDPLCRPFAALPRFSVAGIQDKGVVREDLQIQVDAKIGPHRIQSYAIFLDGVCTQSIPTSRDIKIPIDELSSGYHELRITAFDSSPAHASSTQTFQFFVLPADRPAQPRLRITVNSVDLALDETLVVTGQFPKDLEVQLVQNARVLGKFANGEPLSVDVSKLGLGKTKIYASTTIDDNLVRGVPIDITIQP